MYNTAIHTSFCNLVKVLSQILNLRATELLRFILNAIQREILMKHKAVLRCQVEGGVQENLPAPHPSTLRAHSHQQGGNSTHKLGQGCFFCSGQLIRRILTGQTAKNICLLRVQPQGRHVCQLLHGAGDNMGENAERMQELEDEEESCRIRHTAAAPTKSLHL